MSDLPATPETPRHPRRRRLEVIFGSVVIGWAILAYLVVPVLWLRYARAHPQFDDLPRRTRTGDDIPGDPLNVAFAGSEVALKKIMLAAQWYPADPLTLKSCLEIAEATVLERPYKAAPVSSLYLFGRREDLAFEKPVGADPRQRHHVRLWKTDKVYKTGQPIWVGAAIYDRRVGFSEKTGQITHVTGRDIDAERAFLFRDLEETGDLSDVFFIDNFQAEREGATVAGIRG